MRRVDERVDARAADGRLALPVLGRQQIFQHLLQRELAEVAAQLRRLQHALEFVEAAAEFHDALVGRLQIAQPLGDLNEFFLNGGAGFLAHGADAAGQRLRGLLQRVREGAVHFTTHGIEPRVQRLAGAIDLLKQVVHRRRFGRVSPARLQRASGQRSARRAQNERRNGDRQHRDRHAGILVQKMTIDRPLTIARRPSTIDDQGISTIFPYAPGFITSSCAFGACASGISLPTSGLKPDRCMPAITAA